MKKRGAKSAGPASALIDARINELGHLAGRDARPGKVAFVRGASLEGPARLFNSSLDGDKAKAKALNASSAHR